LRVGLCLLIGYRCECDVSHRVSLRDDTCEHVQFLCRSSGVPAINFSNSNYATPKTSSLLYMPDSSDLSLLQKVRPYRHTLPEGKCSVQERHNLHSASRSNRCQTSTRSPRILRSGVTRARWAVCWLATLWILWPG
jgi:hypothetical protein